MTNYTSSDLISFGEFFHGLKELDSSCKTLKDIAENRAGYNPNSWFLGNIPFTFTLNDEYVSLQQSSHDANKAFLSLKGLNNSFVQEVNSTLNKYDNYYKYYYHNKGHHGIDQIAAKCADVTSQAKTDVKKFIGDEKIVLKEEITTRDNFDSKNKLPELKPLPELQVSNITVADIDSIKALQTSITNYNDTCGSLDAYYEFFNDYLACNNVSISNQASQMNFLSQGAGSILNMYWYSAYYYWNFHFSNSTFNDFAVPLLHPIFNQLDSYMYSGNTTNFEQLNNTCWEMVTLGQNLIDKFINQ